MYNSFSSLQGSATKKERIGVSVILEVLLLFGLEAHRVKRKEDLRRFEDNYVRQRTKSTEISYE